MLIIQIHCKEHKEKPIPIKCVYVETGIACWYGPGFQGKRTASGIKFDMDIPTSAHRKLEFGTLVRVTNLINQKQVITEVIDRGPVSKNKVLDLSKKAAQEIDLIKSGTATVKIEIVGYKILNTSTLMKHYKNISLIKQNSLIFK